MASCLLMLNAVEWVKAVGELPVLLSIFYIFFLTFQAKLNRADDARYLLVAIISRILKDGQFLICKNNSGNEMSCKMF